MGMYDRSSSKKILLAGFCPYHWMSLGEQWMGIVGILVQRPKRCVQTQLCKCIGRQGTVFGLIVAFCGKPGLDTSPRYRMGGLSLSRSMIARSFVGPQAGVVQAASCM